jgi:hypothetical protein
LDTVSQGGVTPMSMKVDTHVLVHSKMSGLND